MGKNIKIKYKEMCLLFLYPHIHIHPIMPHPNRLPTTFYFLVYQDREGSAYISTYPLRAFTLEYSCH